jgi:hypothetical protein
MGVSLVALGSLSRNETEAIQWGRRAPTQSYILSPGQGTSRGQIPRFKLILARLIQTTQLLKIALQRSNDSFDSRRSLAESVG